MIIVLCANTFRRYPWLEVAFEERLGGQLSARKGFAAAWLLTERAINCCLLKDMLCKATVNLLFDGKTVDNFLRLPFRMSGHFYHKLRELEGQKQIECHMAIVTTCMHCHMVTNRRKPETDKDDVCWPYGRSTSSNHEIRLRPIHLLVHRRNFDSKL